MARFDALPFTEFGPGELLGPLNEVERKNAPALLWAAGHLDLLKRPAKVAIVGSRKASKDGLRRAVRLARFLATEGAVVVSGLAEGIDTAAHEGAIQAGGSTIAVLGTPLDQVYPARNAGLQRTIGEQHCLVTQFPVGSRVFPQNFVQRNRTMALICTASVIVEAGESSGSLSQGWEALRLGRPLFVMNSVVQRPDLKWPTEMLRYGAAVLSEPEEILDYVALGEEGPISAAAF
jgi:DNA processing protein